AYAEVEGLKATELARICEAVAESSGVSIGVCPPVAELGAVARSVSIPVLSQNVDPYKPGSATGWMTPSMVKACGCAGTLINHSEHRSDDQRIGECVRMCDDLGLITMVCAESVEKARSVAVFAPRFIAVEPPELIGGDISVTTANPKIVQDTVETVKAVNRNVSVLCGAGVKTGQDVATAISLGADGVLLASGVVKSKDPKATLEDLISKI
ncbi:MAG: triose-phosphate isomerase, partial [Candidatus Methanomethylophilaceae archaeon]|nr:triose-phosphate isomerase [Candidatus Methanomethylophilaceae archaeon]